MTKRKREEQFLFPMTAVSFVRKRVEVIVFEGLVPLRTQCKGAGEWPSSVIEGDIQFYGRSLSLQGE